MIGVGFWLGGGRGFGVGEIGEFSEVAFLQFSGLVVVEKQVVEALDFRIVL